MDDFSAPTSSSATKKPAAATATTVEQAGDDEDLDAMLDDDFAQQLAAGMEELMSGAGEGQDEFKDTFEKIWKSFENTSLDDPATSAPEGPVDPETKKTFQETIAQTMNKLKTSSDKVEVSFCSSVL